MCWGVGVLGCCGVRMLGCWDVEVLCAGVLGRWGVEVLVCFGAVFKCWRVVVLGITLIFCNRFHI
jgi:hypothetical protein